MKIRNILLLLFACLVASCKSTHQTLTQSQSVRDSLSLTRQDSAHMTHLKTDSVLHTTSATKTEMETNTQYGGDKEYVLERIQESTDSSGKPTRVTERTTTRIWYIHGHSEQQAAEQYDELQLQRMSERLDSLEQSKFRALKDSTVNRQQTASTQPPRPFRTWSFIASLLRLFILSFIFYSVIRCIRKK